VPGVGGEYIEGLLVLALDQLRRGLLRGSRQLGVLDRRGAGEGSATRGPPTTPRAGECRHWMGRAQPVPAAGRPQRRRGRRQRPPPAGTADPAAALTAGVRAEPDRGRASRAVLAAGCGFRRVGRVHIHPRPNQAATPTLAGAEGGQPAPNRYPTGERRAGSRAGGLVRWAAVRRAGSHRLPPDSATQDGGGRTGSTGTTVPIRPTPTPWV
jgi:hypothetical protein